jgi:hypothetical protein
VFTDDDSEHSVVVIHDGVPQRRIFADYDAAITRYCDEARARARAQAFLIGTAYEVAGQRFIALSRTSFTDAREALAAVWRDMRELSDCLHCAAAA